MKGFFFSPRREIAISVLVIAALAADFAVHGRYDQFVFGVAVIGALPTVFGGTKSLLKGRISIDTFNGAAVVLSLATGEIRSAAFIVLMLTFASALEWHTKRRMNRAVEELLKLKPLKAFRESDGVLEEVAVESVKTGDTLVVESGSRIPVDGVVVFGTALVNESAVTGESVPREKIVGDEVFSSTLNEDGLLKIRATKVGKDSTIDRIAALVSEAAKHKSRTEKLADHFAGIFLPVVVVGALAVYFLTRNVSMMVALFLVACADDMAVAIPLSITASLGKAAKRGVIIKGGEWFESLAKIKTLVLDKTGTLTYGTLAVSSVRMEAGTDEIKFWRMVGMAEKYSEHPIGRAIFREALKHSDHIPDPDAIKIHKGSGIWARYGADKVTVGTEDLLRRVGISVGPGLEKKLDGMRDDRGGSLALVFLNEKFAGLIILSDTPRPEAKESIDRLKKLGFNRMIIFTGDNEKVAGRVARALDIGEFHASMKPEQKFQELEKLAKSEKLGMVGDGINDAPALARAHIGIAMGGGTSVAVEAADVVILTDNLARLPETVELSRRTLGVVRGDIAIWAISNAVGFALVLTGIAGPSLAAFYNFVADFFPLLNSSRLFRG